jgi:hypothetical protein
MKMIPIKQKKASRKSMTIHNNTDNPCYSDLLKKVQALLRSKSNKMKNNFKQSPKKSAKKQTANQLRIFTYFFKILRNWLIIIILATGIAGIENAFFSFFLLQKHLFKAATYSVTRNKAPPKNEYKCSAIN